MSTFIDRIEEAKGRPRLAVKDLIDVAGSPPTAGSALVARSAQPAEHDAPCLLGARTAGAAIVGKTNLVELAFGTSGVNPWFGTPLNPLDPRLVPGGSSSGSAVAVATGEAEVAYGSDTGGSIRIPSACCGTAGLKTTFGRVPLAGVWPLAPSLDTVGPMAASVAGLVTGMGWLEPGFAVAPQPSRRLGRVRLGATVDPVVEEAIDTVLAAAGLAVRDVELPGWEEAWQLCTRLIEAEAARANQGLLGHLDLLDPPVAQRLRHGAAIAPAEVAEARSYQRRWSASMAEVLTRVEMVVLPTLVGFPPPLDHVAGFPFSLCTAPVNLAGLPALSLPIPAPGEPPGLGRRARLPASIQLVGTAGGEEALLATGLVIESVAANLASRA